jgi:hypothetical protein
MLCKCEYPKKLPKCLVDFMKRLVANVLGIFIPAPHSHPSDRLLPVPFHNSLGQVDDIRQLSLAHRTLVERLDPNKLLHELVPPIRSIDHDLVRLVQRDVLLERPLIEPDMGVLRINKDAHVAVQPKRVIVQAFGDRAPCLADDTVRLAVGRPKVDILGRLAVSKENGADRSAGDDDDDRETLDLRRVVPEMCRDELEAWAAQGCIYVRGSSVYKFNVYD